ncbi:MAG: PfkB family carbohydrate kinase [Cytophagales bacterium]|nr:PfkB family carbohydrate kinase [Cytophagales bacterium]
MNGLFYGLLTIDLHFFTDHFPEENSKTKAKRFDSYIGGPATNAAITFQHLGGKSLLVTAIGQNSFRTMIYDRIRQNNLETIDLKAGEQVEPVFASILTNESSGSRTIFSYHPPQADAMPVPNDLSKYEFVMFDGFYMDAAIPLAKACSKRGIPTILDGGSWKNGTEKLLKYTDIAICSEDFMPPGVVHPEDVTAYLLKNGVQKAAITRGEKSIIVNEGEVNYLIEIPKVKVIDTLGAGDIFHGAFCYYFAKDKQFQDALKRAAGISALSCRYRGPRTWMDKK